MKLIVENIGGEIYVYRETTQHHKKLNRDPKTFSKHTDLDNECMMAAHPNKIFVFDVVSPKRKVKHATFNSR